MTPFKISAWRFTFKVSSKFHKFQPRFSLVKTYSYKSKECCKSPFMYIDLIYRKLQFVQLQSSTVFSANPYAAFSRPKSLAMRPAHNIIHIDHSGTVQCSVSKKTKLDTK